jgi:hypothetical protein
MKIGGLILENITLGMVSPSSLKLTQVIRWNLRPYNWLGADGGVVSAYIIVVGG